MAHPPNRKAWLAIAAAVVLVAAVTGVVLANLPGDQDDTSDISGPASESAAPAGSDRTERVPGTLSVFELGATTPVPEGEWAWSLGPSAANWLYSSGEGYQIGDPWHSVFEAGVFDPNGYADDSESFATAALEDQASAAMQYWAESLFSEASGRELSEVRLREVDIDGHSAVLAEARHSWDSIPDSDDAYEDTAILLVDVDGINWFIALASITETDSEHYDAAVEALLATRIDPAEASW